MPEKQKWIRVLGLVLIGFSAGLKAVMVELDSRPQTSQFPPPDPAPPRTY